MTKIQFTVLRNGVPFFVTQPIENFKQAELVAYKLNKLGMDLEFAVELIKNKRYTAKGSDAHMCLMVIWGEQPETKDDLIERVIDKIKEDFPEMYNDPSCVQYDYVQLLLTALHTQ